MSSIHLQHKLNTHRHSFNTGNMQEKLLFVLNGKCLFLQGVPEHDFNKSRLLLFSLYSLKLFYYYKMRSKLIFYMRGLFELFPPIYLPYSITLNGLSSPQIRSRSQPSNIKGLPTLMPVQKARLHGSTA
jgi:uncharacterized membrane protein YobD (UPF0266 family)